MPNLLVEYTKRNNLQTIPLCHNGVCFFESGEHKLVALTSLPCRSFSTCLSCNPESKYGHFIVELFVAGVDNSFYVAQHSHHSTDSNQNNDLARIVNNATKKLKYPGELTPVFGKTMRDLEVWLWRFITKDSTRGVFKPSEQEEKLKEVELMTWAALYQPGWYSNFYIAYEALLLNRRYMLLDNNE